MKVILCKNMQKAVLKTGVHSNLIVSSDLQVCQKSMVSTEPLKVVLYKYRYEFSNIKHNKSK